MTHITDQIETYLTGGLSPAERSAFEEHILACPQCAALVDEARVADAAMNDLFADARPSADFEDRMIIALNACQPMILRPMIHPMVRRVAVGIAASLMIGGIGYYADRAMMHGQGRALTFLDSGRPQKVSDNLKNIAPAIVTYVSPGRTQFASGSRSVAKGGSQYTLGPTTSVPGSIGKTATSLQMLKSDAIDLTKRGRYEEALGVVDQIQKINPSDDYANGVRPMLEDKSGFQSQRAMFTTHNPVSNLQPAHSIDKSIAYDDVLRYPADWPVVKPSESGPGPAVAWNDAATLAYRFDLSGKETGTKAGGAGGTTFSGTISNGGTVSGTGSLVLPAETTYSGGTTVNAGTLVLNGGTSQLSTAAAPTSGQQTLFDSYALSTDGSTTWAANSAGRKLAETPKDVTANYYAAIKVDGEAPGKDKPVALQTTPATPGLQVADADVKVALGDNKESLSQNQTNGLLGGVAAPPGASTPAPAATPASPDVAFGFQEGEGRKSGGKQAVPAGGEAGVAANTGLRVPEVPAKTPTFNGPIYKPEVQTTEGKKTVAVPDGDALALGGQKQEEERGKTDPIKPQENLAVVQVEEDRKRAALERGGTIRDLQKTADDLTKQGRTKDAEAVVAQIQQLDPKAKPTAIVEKEVDQKTFPLLTGKVDDQKPNPAAPVVPPVQNPQPAPVQVAAPAMARPKIIRTGEMEFEIESFEVAVDTIKKIVEEEGGYVSTTDSDKLPNGKVKGNIVLRAAPERLDTLVLKLRGIGDLKTQNIRAQDITKQYTDMESRLRAAQAMYDQIFDIIKSGKAAVKDLLEAEKQLGVWREKVEQLQGEINYYANQVSLSTLTLTLFEKDIRTPAVASETETVTMTVVTEKVEDAAGKAKEAIATAKGRIIASQIEQHDAGEFLATITAQVPPDAADAVIARLRQIDGQVNHFDRQRSQTTSNGTSPVDARSTDPVKVKREDVTINLTLFNLAKLTPRRQTDMTLAAKNVDEAKTALEEQVRAAGGRIIDSRTEYPRPDQKKGTISFDVPSEKADALIATLKGLGESLQISTVENPNAQGVTESKRGFAVTIFDLAAVPPRRVTSLMLVTENVDQVQHALIDQLRAAGGKVLDAKIEHPTPEKTSGTLSLEIPADKADAFLAAVKQAGEALQVSATDNSGQQSVTDSKRGIVIGLRSLTMFTAREREQVQLASATVQDTFNDLRTMVHAQKGRVLTEHLDEQDRSNPIGQLEFEISRDAAAVIDQQMGHDGQIVTRVDDRSTDTDNTVDSKVYVRLLISSAEQLPPRQSSDLSIETQDVQRSMDDLRALALSAGGRQVDNPAISQTDGGQTTGTVRLDVPLDKVQSLLDAADGMGARKGRNTSIDTHAPDGKLARARLTVTFASPATLTSADDGIWAGVRRGLGTSLHVLSISVMLIIIGLCVVVPFGVVLWAGWRGVKWARKDSTVVAPSGTAVGG